MQLKKNQNFKFVGETLQSSAFMSAVLFAFQGIAEDFFFVFAMHVDMF